MTDADGQVLAAVLEYGELPEVLRAADIVGERLRCRVIVWFVKPSYRRLAPDTAMVISRGHRWMDASGRIHDVPAVMAEAENGAAAPADGPIVVAAGDDSDRHGNDKDDSPVVVPAAGRLARPLALALATPVVLVTAIIAIAIRLAAAFKELAIDLANLRADVRRFVDRARDVDAIVERLAPVLVVVGQDTIGSELAFLLQSAKRRRIPTMLIPFGMFNLRELAAFALGRPSHHRCERPLNRALAALYPSWVVVFRGKPLLRLPGSRGLALELSGLVHGHPWIPCSEPVDVVACDSRVSERAMRRMGLPEDRLVVVGAPVHDRLARALASGKAGKRELVVRFGLDPERPLVACGWPANIFAWLGERRIAYADYQSLAQVWADALAAVRDRHGVEVLVSIHPKTLDEEVVKARSSHLAVVRGDSELMVAHCDLFTTLNGSSLTAWAIACAKPVLLFDCFATRYDEFNAVPGSVMTTDEAAFTAELDRLCASAMARAELAAAQAAVAADWGVLDGASDQRIADLASRLVGAHAAPRLAVAAPDLTPAAEVFITAKAASAPTGSSEVVSPRHRGHP